MLDQLYSGNQVSCTAFKEMVYEMEGVLSLDEKANRMRIRLRLDGGFGSDENINFALSRGYGLLIKMYSGNRARVLAESVEKWVSAPTQRQRVVIRRGEQALVLLDAEDRCETDDRVDDDLVDRGRIRVVPTTSPRWSASPW